LIAVHETGHALAALLSRKRLVKVSLRETESSLGTERYLASTVVEPVDRANTVTVNELIYRVRIALGGYASEIVCFDGRCGMGGDDLTMAERFVEDMMELPDFKRLAESLPSPEPGQLDMVKNPTVRAFIDYQIGECVRGFLPLKSLIEKIAHQLDARDELSGFEVAQIFNSFVPPQMRVTL
jgi:ATP-dependent Zn protease